MTATCAASRVLAALGVLVAALAMAPAASADAWGIDVRDAPGGAAAEIVSVASGTPADLASLVAGDQIVHVLGKPVTGATQYRQAIAAAGSVDELTLVVMRGGWSKEVRLRAVAPSLSGFGLAVVARSGGEGAEVAAVTSGGPAAQAGILPGDVITAAAGAPLAGVAGLQQSFAEHAARAEPLVLTVERSNWSKQVTLTPRTLRDARVPAPVAAPVPAPAPVAQLPLAAESPRPVAAPEAAAAAVPPGGGATDVMADMGAANRAYDVSNWRDAEIHYQRVVRVITDEANSWARLCHAQVMLQKYGDAAQTCRTATQFAAREASVYQNLGYTLYRLGRAAESVNWYRKAAELAPGWALPHSGLGASYFALGDWAKAEDSYRSAVAHDPQDAPAWQAIGDAAAELGKPAEAVAAYRKSIALRAGSAELYRGLGWQLFRAGELADAENAFREANRLNPKDAHTLVILGTVADKLGRSAEAREAWQRAAQLEPDTANGAMARQNLASLDARQATGRASPIAVPSPPTRAASAAVRDDAKARSPAGAADEPRAIVEPETDSGI